MPPTWLKEQVSGGPKDASMAICLATQSHPADAAFASYGPHASFEGVLVGGAPRQPNRRCARRPASRGLALCLNERLSFSADGACMEIPVPFHETLHAVLECRRRCEADSAAEIADVGAGFQDVTWR